jgi:hypothetical protein
MPARWCTHIVLEPASHIEGPELQRCKLALEISHITTNGGALRRTGSMKCVLAAKHKTVQTEDQPRHHQWGCPAGNMYMQEEMRISSQA